MLLSVAQSTLAVDYQYAITPGQWNADGTVSVWRVGIKKEPNMNLPKWFWKHMEFPYKPANDCVYYTQWNGRKYSTIATNGHENCVPPPPPPKKVNVIGYTPTGCASDLGNTDHLEFGEKCRTGEDLLKAVNVWRDDPIEVARWIQKFKCRNSGSQEDLDYNANRDLDETIDYIVGLNNDEYYIMSHIKGEKNYMDATYYTASLMQLNKKLTHYSKDEKGDRTTPQQRLAKFTHHIRPDKFSSENVGFHSAGTSCMYFVQMYIVDYGVTGKGHRKSFQRTDYEQGGAGVSDDGIWNAVQFGDGYMLPPEDEEKN